MSHSPAHARPRQPARTSTFRFMGMPLSALAFLALTAAISLLVSHYRLMWFDEYLVLNTDSVAGVRQLLHVQRNWPIALDPIGYHLLAHCAIRVFGAGAFAIRLPSLLGYLLMQACLFLFVSRIASERAALFAMAFPSLLFTQYFAVDGRPYGLLLGLYGLVLLCWQTAARREAHRVPALILLTVALAYMLNTHYFAVLLLVPLYAAELFRTLQHRRPDLPMLASIGMGTAAIVFVLPFVKGAAEYRQHYIALNVSLQFIPQAYRTLLVFPDGAGGIGRTLFLTVLILALLWGCARLLTHRVQGMSAPEYVLVITLAALPVFGYLLGHFVTHAAGERFVIAATLGMAIIMAAALAPLLHSRRFSCIVFGLMFFVIVAHGAQRIYRERRERQQRLSGLVLSPAIKAAMMGSSDHLLYVEDLGTFFFARLYAADPQLRSSVALVCSRAQELQIMHQDTYWLQDTHLNRFTDARVVAYESITSQPGEHLFLTHDDPYQWIDRALIASHANVRDLGLGFGSLGPGYDGEFFAVTFPPAGHE